MNMMIVVCK